MNENTISELERQLKKYVDYINDLSKTADEIKEQEDILKDMLDVQKNEMALEINEQEEKLGKTLEAFKGDEVVENLKNAQDVGKRTTFRTLENQVESTIKEFSNAVEERKEKEQEEASSQVGQGVTTQEKNDLQSGYDKPTTDVNKTDIDLSEDNTSESESIDNTKQENEDSIDEAKEIEELERKAEEVESAIQALYGAKNSVMKSCSEVGTILQERAVYEKTQDDMNYEVASYIIEKTVLATKRQDILIDISKEVDEISKAGGSTERLEELQFSLSTIDNEIKAKDLNFEGKYSKMQADVAKCDLALKNTSKEVIKRVHADLSNSYVSTKRYNEAGVLQSKDDDVTKSMSRIVLRTQYNANMIADGEKGSINEVSVSALGKTVRIISTEYEKGVETSYYMGNNEMANNDIGKTGTTSKTYNGSIIAEDPDITSAFRKAGINPGSDGNNTIDSIEEAMAVIEDKAEKQKEEEKENKVEIPFNSENGTKYNT